jgi:pyruvate formate lyase activating enzyme
MDFSGWEKLSLLDFDDNITTTLFMAGCDFRCPFCHNSSLVLNPKSAPTIPWEDIMAISGRGKTFSMRSASRVANPL